MYVSLFTWWMTDKISIIIMTIGCQLSWWRGMHEHEHGVWIEANKSCVWIEANKSVFELNLKLTIWLDRQAARLGWDTSHRWYRQVLFESGWHATPRRMAYKTQPKSSPQLLSDAKAPTLLLPSCSTHHATPFNFYFLFWKSKTIMIIYTFNFIISKF